MKKVTVRLNHAFSEKSESWYRRTRHTCMLCFPNIVVFGSTKGLLFFNSDTYEIAKLESEEIERYSESSIVRWNTETSDFTVTKRLMGVQQNFSVTKMIKWDKNSFLVSTSFGVRCYTVFPNIKLLKHLDFKNISNLLKINDDLFLGLVWKNSMNTLHSLNVVSYSHSRVERILTGLFKFVPRYLVQSNRVFHFSMIESKKLRDCFYISIKSNYRIPVEDSGVRLLNYQNDKVEIEYKIPFIRERYEDKDMCVFNNTKGDEILVTTSNYKGKHRLFFFKTMYHRKGNQKKYRLIKNVKIVRKPISFLCIENKYLCIGDRDGYLNIFDLRQHTGKKKKMVYSENIHNDPILEFGLIGIGGGIRMVLRGNGRVKFFTVGGLSLRMSVEKEKQMVSEDLRDRLRLLFENTEIVFSTCKNEESNEFEKSFNSPFRIQFFQMNIQVFRFLLLL